MLGQKIGDVCSGAWEVHTKGAADEEGFEIVVIRADNEHGKRSYGWIDENKLLISHNGGPCRWPVISTVWDRLLKVAQEVADELNASEGR